MRYMTKEWYETMQKTDFYSRLKVSKDAELFSERYFKELYKSEENKWLELQENVSNVKFEDIYPEVFHACNVDGSPLEKKDFERLEREYFEQREKDRLEFNNRPPFNPLEEKKKFKHVFHLNINKLKENLPDKILKKVADIRVLALDYASLEVKNDITKYCKMNEEKVQKAEYDYQEHFKKHFESDVPTFVSELCLHDCDVLSCRKDGNDIVMIVDNSYGITKINKIRMKNCDVIKQDAPLHGACCLYEEVYKSGERYEVHFLLQKNKLIDYIVLVDDMEFQYNK